MFDKRWGDGADGCGYVEMDPTGRYGRFEDVLGKGAVKTVYRAFDELEGMEVAWNQAKVFDVLRSPEGVERLYAEVHLLGTLHHDSIIRFLSYWIDAGKRTFNFVTEMFTSGTLREYRQRYKCVNIRAVKNWACQILHGLAYLHGHNPPVIHRDLKCDNILINGHLGQVKIGDLGLAAVLKGSQQAHSVIGTPEFMAPELYEEEYNELVDIYSFGMCLLEILTGEYPYSECSNPAQIYKKVTMGKLPKAFHQLQDLEAKRFIELCLEKASKRPSAKELLLDPFLQIDKDAPQSSFQGGFHGDSLDDHLFPHQLPALKQKKRANTDMKITGKLNPDDDTIFLRVQISDKNGHSRNIYFPFDIVNDTPVDVANEMVKELEITDRDPLQIARMIDQEISALVPHWKDEVPESGGQHTYSFQEEDDGSTHHPFFSLSSPSSSQSSCFSPTYLQEYRGFSSHDWLQDMYPDDDDDTTSHISMNSGKYSSVSYSSGKQECGTSTRRQNIPLPSPRGQNPSKQCFEETRRTEEPPNVKFHKQYRMPLEPPPASSQLEKMSPSDRKLLRNRSLVNMRSQLLHQKLVEEVNKRHFKTVGAVENIGFQNPYETSNKGKRSSHIHGPIKNLGLTWGRG